MSVKLAIAIPNYRESVSGRFLDCMVGLDGAPRMAGFGPGEIEYRIMDWRALPEAVQWMFRGFSTREIPASYGNPTTVIAAYLGIAAGQCRRDELDEIHLDYPVATCIWPGREAGA